MLSFLSSNLVADMLKDQDHWLACRSIGDKDDTSLIHTYSLSLVCHMVHYNHSKQSGTKKTRQSNVGNSPVFPSSVC